MSEFEEFGKIARLRRNCVITEKSAAAPGFMRPEGVIIYLSAARAYFKQTLEKDEEPKSAPRS